jgi:hypothetical protein
VHSPIPDIGAKILVESQRGETGHTKTWAKQDAFVWMIGVRLRRGEPGILALVAEGDLPQAMQVASASRHPVARVLGSGIAAKHLSPSSAMQAAAQAEVSQARRYLPILGTPSSL